MDINKITIKRDATMFDALIMIDANHMGFLIVVDEEGKAIATLTDGDIRRSVIRGNSMDASIEKAWNTDFTYLSDDAQFNDVIDIFKDGRIHFIPILNADKSLVNVIPKAAMHALLLRDMHPSLDYAFLDVDTSIVDHEVFQRPWGFYKTTILNDMFQSKIISVLPGESLSLQLHRHREEHWVVVNGDGEVRIGDSSMPVRSGSYIFIPKGCKHRVSNLSNDESLILIEVQCGEYFGEDDIERFEDNYGRV